MEKKISKDALQPLIDYCESTYGAKAVIHREMEKLAGKSIVRPSIDRWLHPKPEERVEPSLSYGLMLLQIAEKLIKPSKRKKKK